eukprot:TRINITY_DN818_c0_g1_i2.p1 TRINITY_DN818_c0_g1~~TRINITY_DN818_c0_g1_i2.p1  ORF type:complete len:278 (-),score=53.38 TRINITY_DN818_c0_g1_i2:211-1044(-)
MTGGKEPVEESSQFMEACSLGQVDRVKELLDILWQVDLDVDHRDEKGFTALYYASLQGHYDVVDFLLSIEASVNQTTLTKLTPLHAAAQQRHVDVLLRLLTEGANPNFIRPDTASTALYLASRSGDEEIVEILLSHGAHVDRGDISMKWTPLYAACEMGHENVVRQLLAYGAKANSVAKTGMTPLMVACAFGLITIVKLLIRHGADPFLGSGMFVNGHHRKSARTIAQALNYSQIVDLLEEAEIEYSAPTFERRLRWSSHQRKQKVPSKKGEVLYEL